MDIHTRWEVAAIYSYAHIFQKLWHLPQILAEDIEDGCTSLCEDVASQFFVDFFIALLQSFRKTVYIWYESYELVQQFRHLFFFSRDNYEEYLKRIAGDVNKTSPLRQYAEQSFWSLSTISRLDLLMSLCMTRIDLDVANPESKFKDFDASEMRVEPIGEDSNGNIYWHFGDTRLYRDIPPPPPPKPKKKYNLSQCIIFFYLFFNHFRPATPKAKVKKKGYRGGKRSKRKSPTKKDTHEQLDESVAEPEPEEIYDPTHKWELIASTVEQWEEFVATLSKSKKAKDVELTTHFKEELMPLLPELFSELEKLMKKRALALAPRRQSNRLEDKRKAFVDAGRFISFIAHDGQVLDNGNAYETNNGTPLRGDHDLSMDGSEPRRKFKRAPMTNEEILEQKRLEEEEKERQKQEAASARANRANRRAVGLPAIDLDASSEHNHTFDSVEEEDDDMETVYYLMEEICASVKQHADAGPFIEPVPVAIAPDYYEIIKNPMDLNTIGTKVMQRQYQSIEEMVADFDQLCRNCLLYNGDTSPYSVGVRRLSRHFQSLLKKNFPLAAKDRIQRGYVGQPAVSRYAAARSRFNTSGRQSSSGEESDDDDVETPDAAYVFDPDDPDYSPRRETYEPDDQIIKGSPPPSKKQKIKQPKSSSKKRAEPQPYVNFYNDLSGSSKKKPIARLSEPIVGQSRPYTTQTIVTPHFRQVQRPSVIHQPVQAQVAYYRPTIGDAPTPVVRKTPVAIAPNPGLRTLLTVGGSPVMAASQAPPSAVKIRLVSSGRPGQMQASVVNAGSRPVQIVQVIPATSINVVAASPTVTKTTSNIMVLPQEQQKPLQAQQSPVIIVNQQQQQRVVTANGNGTPITTTTTTTASNNNNRTDQESNGNNNTQNKNYKNAFLNFIAQA